MVNIVVDFSEMSFGSFNCKSNGPCNATLLKTRDITCTLVPRESSQKTELNWFFVG